MILKQSKLIITAALLVALLYIPTAWAADTKVAEVNGVIITQKDFEQAMNSVQQNIMHQTGQPMDPAQYAEIRDEVLDNLINREVLHQETQRLEITVDDATVDQQLERVKGQFPSEAEFKQMLTGMRLDETAVRQQFRQDLSIQKLINDQVVEAVKVPEEDVRKFYAEHPEHFEQSAQVQARHILLKVEPDADDAQKQAAREKLTDIQAQLKDGGDFAELAAAHSDCPSGQQGGDLGYFGKGQMVQPFEAAAFTLETGETSDIVETRFGYHLIQVLDSKPGSTVSYDDSKERIEQFLKKDQVQKEVESYVNKLRGEAKVEKFME